MRVGVKGTDRSFFKGILHNHNVIRIRQYSLCDASSVILCLYGIIKDPPVIFHDLFLLK